ncbi:MAG: copper resistance protein B [Sphingomonas fennica]
MIARIVGIVVAAASAPVAAQHHHMPGMTMPMPARPADPKPAAAPRRAGKAGPTAQARRAAPKAAPAADPHAGHMTAAPAADPHAGHTMAAPAADPHAGHTMSAPVADPHAGHTMAAPAADPHAGHTMSAPVADPYAGHTMAAPVADPHAGHTITVPAADPHAGHTMAPPAADPHASHAAAHPAAGVHAGHGGAADAAPVASVPPAGDAPPPPVPHDHYAERLYPASDMARARAQMMREGGAQRFHQVFLNIAEARVGQGRDGYRWDGEGWYGGDIHRAVVKSEGEGDFGGRPEAAEVQALYSRAIGPYFDVQAGVRHDLRPSPDRTYATIGVEGLAPYWFEVEAALFLSTRGDVSGRLEAWYDQRLTQRLVLQPRAELNLAAQDDAATRVGRGLASAELGLRLRYEVAREFAPYVGLSWEARTGRSARLARAAGDDPRVLGLVGGVRFWF